MRNPFTGQFVSQRDWLQNVIAELLEDAKVEYRAGRITMAKALLADKAVYAAQLQVLSA